MLTLFFPIYCLFSIFLSGLIADDLRHKHKGDHKAKKSHFSVHKECRRSKMVALTFDDGVVPATSDILDVLDHYDVPATFFVVGNTLNIDSSYYRVLKRIIRSGHTLGSHTFDHLDLAYQSYGEIKSQLESTGDVIENAIGKRPRFLRPPYGSVSDAMLEVTEKLGYEAINWNVDTNDWKTSYDHGLIIDSLYAQEDSHGSKIVLMHDRPFTAETLKSVIKYYEKRGYTFVNMEKCLGMRGYF